MNKLPKIIAIDSGKKNLKARCGVSEIIYPNKYSEGCDDVKLLDKKSWKVTYNGEVFTVGNTGTSSDKKEGKDSEAHIISTLTAITHFLDIDEPNNNIKLVYGESANKYFIPTQREKIKRMLEKPHSITVETKDGSKTFDFKITEVLVLPEGIGHILMDFNKYRGQQYVIDIGGKTINFLSVINGRPIKEESFSLGKGVINVIDRVDKAFRTNESIGELPRAIIEQYVEHGCDTNEEINSIISKCVIKQLREFNEALEEKNIYVENILKNFKINFIGGGSELFKKEIEEVYNNRATIIEEPVMANVRGFYKFGFSNFGGDE